LLEEPAMVTEMMLFLTDPDNYVITVRNGEIYIDSNN
jgi:hypothetical protein